MPRVYLDFPEPNLFFYPSPGKRSHRNVPCYAAAIFSPHRFTLLKKTLDEVVRSYPHLAAPGTASGGGLGGGNDSGRTAEEVK